MKHNFKTQLHLFRLHTGEITCLKLTYEHPELKRTEDAVAPFRLHTSEIVCFISSLLSVTLCPSATRPPRVSNLRPSATRHPSAASTRRVPLHQVLVFHRELYRPSATSAHQLPALRVSARQPPALRASATSACQVLAFHRELSAYPEFPPVRYYLSIYPPPPPARLCSSPSAPSATRSGEIGVTWRTL